MLNLFNHFSSTAEFIVEHYYKIPFPEYPSKELPYNPKEFTINISGINRVVHGAMHASRVSIYVKILHDFRSSCLDPLAKSLINLSLEFNLTESQIIHLIQLAALFHDSARENEGVDHWDKESADKLNIFLQEHYKDLNPVFSDVLVKALCFKDKRQEFITALLPLNLTASQVEEMDYIRQLIADADCLDIIRIRKNFRMKFLNICNSEELKGSSDKVLNLVKKIRGLIEMQKDMYFPCNIIALDETIHVAEDNSFSEQMKIGYENDPNTYQKIINDVNLINWGEQS